MRFDNSYLRELPTDPESANFRRQVRGACASRVEPTPVAAPWLVAWSAEVAELVGLEATPTDPARMAALFGGNELLPGMEPFAACYGGHQFGNWAGQLGDGRAISLGETVNDAGQRWELQLKGAGPTPYSRSGDGRAVMRSSVREFLCSEAMHHLGVPTTRALSLVGTGDDVVRDMFYDGNPRPEPGAVVCRVAPSFIRFGHFEILATQGNEPALRRLADYTIETHYPEYAGLTGPDRYLALLREVCRRTASMVVHWARVGFVHGVMNTDNMSVLGLTIDYGPYGWLDVYDPAWTPNTTDAGQRRYRFGNQPPIAGWNLVRLAEALYPLVGEAGPLETALEEYGRALDRELPAMLLSKLGLSATGTAEADQALLRELLEVLQLVETDMTIFYRCLANVPSAEAADDQALWGPMAESYYDAAAAEQTARDRTLLWLRQYTARVRQGGASDDVRKRAMDAVNPKYVLRNYVAQLAIDEAEKGDGSKVVELLDVLRRPYDEQPGREEYAARRPDWARHRAGCSMLSCSS